MNSPAKPAFHNVHPISVEFGDCDPAQIVFYPNFFRWFDAASRHYFAALGVPAWRDLCPGENLIGTPLVDASARFIAPATYGDSIEIDSHISEWRGKSFVFTHIARRGTTILCEGQEIRVFAASIEGDRHRIRAVPVPESVRRLCGG
jgi:4-hydroxybenzoyl-CoA thioesterase